MSDSTGSADDFARVQMALAGSWSVERELGRGGMGTVYLAREVALDRPVALKVLHSALAAQPDQRARFLAEARTAARLSHPNIVPIFSVEERDDIVFFAMGLVDGESLGARVRREGPVDPAIAEQYLREVGWALGYAHSMGIVHRDVTLENILIERSTGRCLLADFGIAAEIDRAGDGPLLGTPTYLAPEIIQGEPATPQSDLYALAVSGWFMLAGRPPFMAVETPTLLLQHLTEVVPTIVRAAPATPSRLARAIERGMAKDRSDRSDSVESWLALLEQHDDALQLTQPLRHWVNRWQLFRPIYALAMTVTAMVTYKMALGLLRSESTLLRTLGNWIPAVLGPIVAVFGVVAVAHLGFELAALRRLSRRGFGLADVEIALARLRDEARRQGSKEATLLGRLVNDFAWLSAITFLLVGFVILPSISAFIVLNRGEAWITVEYETLLRIICQWAYIAFWSGIGFSILVPATRSAPDGVFARMRAAFWGGLPGRVMLRIASVGLGKHLPAAETLHRPTELVLDLAIEDLWQALPPISRRNLGDVPRLTENLRHRIAEVKELEQLMEHSRMGHSEETTALRTRLAEQHQAGVTALERLRLLLGKLTGAAAPDSEFTEQLASARGVEQELLKELGAHKDLRKLLKKNRTQVELTPQLTPT